MKTKIKLLTTVFLVFTTIVSFAQREERKPPSIEERITHTMDAIEKNIDINESQKEAIEKAYRDFFETVDQIMQSGERPDKEVMEQHESDRDLKIKAVLTSEQYENYLKVSCTLKPKPDQNHGGQRPPKQ